MADQRPLELIDILHILDLRDLDLDLGSGHTRHTVV